MRTRLLCPHAVLLVVAGLTTALAGCANDPGSDRQQPQRPGVAEEFWLCVPAEEGEGWECSYQPGRFPLELLR